MTWRWAVLLCGLLPLTGEEFARGTLIPKVACRGNEAQSYALYLPSNYSPDKKWPVLYCLDPGARGHVPVERFAEAAEHAGFIVAGSNNSRNGPMEPVVEAIQWLVRDTLSRFAADEGRLYSAGFSGGSRVALSWAVNAKLAGVVAGGAAFGGGAVPKEIPFKIYIASGVDDFNHIEMWELSVALAKRGTPHRFVEFEGGHEWLPARLAREALDFFNGQVEPNTAADSKDARRDAERYTRMYEEIWSSDVKIRRGMLDRLLKSASKPEDNSDRRVARRVLGGTAIRGMEEGRRLMREKDYPAAASNLDAAAHARPERAEVWYSAAVAWAAAGEKKESLSALARAFEKGFQDRARADSEPLLAPVRAMPAYRSLVER